MEINLTSGNKKIISSGTFITFATNPSVISIQRGTEKILFMLDFIEDKTNPNPKFEIMSKNQTTDELVINLKLYNFNHQLGVGLKEALNVATFNNGDRVYLYLWSRQLGESASREISYTIYLEEIRNG